MNVYETLLTYRHVDGPTGYRLVPGLAQSLPTVSRNGKVYKFKLRKGLKYSNGAAVKASDFEWAIKRGFLAQGQGVGFYTDIALTAGYISESMWAYLSACIPQPNSLEVPATLFGPSTVPRSGPCRGRDRTERPWHP